MRKHFDRVGRRYGHFVVVRMLEDGRWECCCDCNNLKIIKTSSLKNGHSCGCRRTASRLRNNLKNEFIVNVLLILLLLIILKIVEKQSGDIWTATSGKVLCFGHVIIAIEWTRDLT